MFLYKDKMVNGRSQEFLQVLSGELERQAYIYQPLGISKDVFMRLVVPRPDGLPHFLSIPVVHFSTSVDLNRQIAFAGITTKLDLSHQKDVDRGITFTHPHLIYMQAGSYHVNENAAELRSSLKPNERPATLFDVIPLTTIYPELVSVELGCRVMDIPGTNLNEDGTSFVPSLEFISNKFTIKHEVRNGGDLWFGATCGG